MGRAARRKQLLAAAGASPAVAASPAPLGDGAMRRRHLGTALGLFLLAFAVRIAFWQATPGTGWPYSPYFKGDAVVWLDYAQALRHGEPFELGLPIHPPGAGYLLSWVWDGTTGGVTRLRLGWRLLGALIPALVYLAALRSFGYGVAAGAGAACAVSTGLLMLSTSLNNETPYLVLVVASLWLFDGYAGIPRRQAWVRLVAWSALHGLACLLRVEHVLFYGLLLVFLVWSSSKRGSRRAALGAAGAALVVFAATLAPWHVRAWRAIERVNTEPPADPASRAAVEAVERRLAGIDWDPEARSQRDGL